MPDEKPKSTRKAAIIYHCVLWTPILAAFLINQVWAYLAAMIIPVGIIGFGICVGVRHMRHREQKEEPPC